MDYTIIHVNDDRKENRQKIHTVMDGISGNYIPFEFCYGKYANLEEWYKKTGVRNHGWLKKGEEGIWQSLASVWRNMTNDLLLFEDDALLHPDFAFRLEEALGELPSDADFLSLFVPEEQEQDFYYIIRYDENGHWHPADSESKYRFDIGANYIARAYNGWGGQALYFTLPGAKKLLKIAQEKGMYTTSDCFLYLEAHAGNVNGYSMLPKYGDTVYIDKSTKSIIQES